jgi:hypothetical protein
MFILTTGRVAVIPENMHLHSFFVTAVCSQLTCACQHNAKSRPCIIKFSAGNDNVAHSRARIVQQ